MREELEGETIDSKETTGGSRKEEKAKEPRETTGETKAGEGAAKEATEGEAQMTTEGRAQETTADEAQEETTGKQEEETGAWRWEITDDKGKEEMKEEKDKETIVNRRDKIGNDNRTTGGAKEVTEG